MRPPLIPPAVPAGAVTGPDLAGLPGGLGARYGGWCCGQKAGNPFLRWFWRASMPNANPSRDLAAFASQLRFRDLPAAVVRRSEELFLDWIGSALAGKGARPVEAI